MITAQDIREKTFEKSRIGGYDMASVDNFLEEIADDITAAQKENSVLKSKMKVLVDKIEEYRANEEALNLAVISAQKLAVQIEADARTRAAAEVCGVGLAVVAAARAEAKAHAGNGNDGHAVGRLDRLSDDGVGIDHITDLIHRGVHEIVERGLLFDVFHEVHPFFLCGQFFTVFTVLRSALRWFFRGSVVFMRLFIA